MPTANAAYQPESENLASEASADEKVTFSPRETVSELDRYIIGQGNAKRDPGTLQIVYGCPIIYLLHRLVPN